MKNRYTWAEATFGSANRGDADSLSDRDILIVSDDIEVLTLRSNTLQAEGWSVATYTWRKLEAICLEGALFVQHLKLESTIHRDDDGRLAGILASFRPKLDYSAEIAMNNQLLRLAQTYPAGSSGALWAADILYVGLRNFGVLKLAELEKYVFSYYAILDELASANVIDGEAIGDLRALRWAKTLYRKGNALPLTRAESLLANIVSALPDQLIAKTTAVSPLSILEHAAPLDKNRPAYHRLRHLEKIYLSIEATYPSACTNDDFKRLKRWIEDPRSYASFAQLNEKSLIAGAVELTGNLSTPTRTARSYGSSGRRRHFIP